MATEKQLAPYAPVDNVLTVIRRLRERGLPDPLTLQELERVGIPTSNTPRNLVALKFLGLVNEEGYRTKLLDRLGRANTDEYADVLSEIVRGAYASIFTVVDPAADDEVRINDAFRHYEPHGQRERMVRLFLGLCREAGIVPGGPPQRRARRRRTIVGSQPSATGTLTRAEPRPTTQAVRPEPVAAQAQVPEPTVVQTGTDYRLISALMQQLPNDGRWTREKRDQWVQAVSASIDLLTEIVDEEVQ